MKRINEKIYFTVGSGSVGGCERRFFDIYREMRTKGYPVGLICPSMLLDSLLKNEDPVVDENIISIPMDRWDAKEYIVKLVRVIINIPKGCSYHYPINCLWPLHFLRGDRVTMSIVDCHSSPKIFSLNKHSFWHALSSLVVDGVDILSPRVYKEMKGETKRKFSLTKGGTSVRPFGPFAMRSKNTVSLITRLAPGKGVLEFLSSLEETSRILRDVYSVETNFNIYGDGLLAPDVKEKVESLSAHGVRIRFNGFKPFKSALEESSIVLSLQDVTNYPSRVVAESLMAGRCVLVRDTGDSREFGDMPGLHYSDKKINPSDIAHCISRIISEIENDEHLPQKIHEQAFQKFSTDVGLEYFSEFLNSFRK